MDNIREAVWSGTSSNVYTGWAIYLKTLKYLENYALDKKKCVMKVVRLEGGHPMKPNSTPHCHPLGVGVGGRVYHCMSPFETNNFHYPLFFIQCIVLEIFQRLQINGPPCIYMTSLYSIYTSRAAVLAPICAYSGILPGPFLPTQDSCEEESAEGDLGNVCKV